MPGWKVVRMTTFTKPFSPRELVARIKAVLRRRAPQMTDDVVDVNGLRLDPTTHRVTALGRPLVWVRQSFACCIFFMTHSERVHSRFAVAGSCLGRRVFVEERTVDVHIRRHAFGAGAFLSAPI